jgi:squalene-hopene/tetraprenyl-beta-curcumene cyclase
MPTRTLLAICLGLGAFAPLGAADAPPAPSKAEVEAVIDEAQAWMMSKQQPDGTFAQGQFQLGITALATEALAAGPDGLAADSPEMKKAFAYLLGNAQPDGGIYLKDQGLGNYCTALTLMALAASHQLEANKDLVKKAQAYEFSCQITDGPNKGGIGYDQEDGPTHQDIPNTVMGLAGLAASGIPASDPHMQEALHFLEHCQHLTSVNPAPWVDPSPKNLGSAAYSPSESNANGSFPEKEDKDSPRTKLDGTASMTYALLSGYIALDLKPGDPRLDAALDWCKRNYNMDANAGMPEKAAHEGLLYFYQMLAKTMHALNVTTLTLPDGKTVDWRADLFAAIKAHGKEIPLGDKKGMMFMNDAQRWGEGFPTLATAYLLKALKDIDASLP